MVPEFMQLGEKISSDGKLSSRVVVAKVSPQLRQHHRDRQSEECLTAALGAFKHSTSFARQQVDADKHRELGNRFDIKGFPTILYFARGKPVEAHQPCVISSRFPQKEGFFFGIFLSHVT